YAYKIYIKGKDDEKQENYYNVIFFYQNENESISKCTISAFFTITEVNLIDLKDFSTLPKINEKYFVTFKFENENLTRTLDMNLNYEAWIDKLIKDKQKLRGNIDLTSEYMRTRFIKPASESNIEIILSQIKEEREEGRKKDENEKLLKERKKKCLKTENVIHKKSFYEDIYELDHTNSQADFNTPDSNDNESEIRITKNEENDKLNEVLSFLKSNLYYYFTDVDINKKGKLKHNYYVEILKMVNHKMCISRRYLEQMRQDEEKEDIDFANSSYRYFFCEQDEVSSTSTGTNTDDSTNEKELYLQNSVQKNKTKNKKINRKDDKKYLSNLFNVSNKEVDLIKDISIYKNNNFNDYNIFFEESYKVPLNSEYFLFNKDNEYYKFIFTDNYYDFLLYISYADEEENGCIYYNNYINSLPRYLYELKKNREQFSIMSLDNLLLYKQLMYVCYENELNFMYDIFFQQFKKFDLSDSGYIHRTNLKKILEQNDHILSRQEYKILLHIFHYNDDNYVYYKNIKETILRLRFEAIKNSIFERDKKLLQKYLCEELIKKGLKNKKKMHIFDCKSVLDSCDKLYLNKNTIHIILSSLNFDENLELDVVLFLKVSITIIINSIKLENMQMIYNIITDEKEKKEEFQKEESNGPSKRKKTNKKNEKTNIPALELVERTLTKLFKVLDEKNEEHLKIIDFIETLLESNQKKKIIDIKEICKLSKNELQGFVAEIDTESKKKKILKEPLNNSSFEFYKNQKIHYASHIHKWCSKTYQIR
ncbi:conserved Plasmodium protein, unknown function, partial [Plasmodium malariae]